MQLTSYQTIVQCIYWHFDMFTYDTCPICTSFAIDIYRVGGGEGKVEISILNETPHKEDNYFDECKFLENHSLLY
jgi:hypothetical protein